MVFLVVLRHKLMLHALKAINLPLNYSYIPSFYFKYLIELGSDALWAWDALWWMTFYYLFISLLVIVPLWFSLIHDSVLLGCIYIYILELIHLLLIGGDITDKLCLTKAYFLSHRLCAVSSHDKGKGREFWRFLYRN